MQKILHAILVNFQFQPLNKNCEKIKKAKNKKVKRKKEIQSIAWYLNPRNI
jgi:hypothetical protein